MKRNYELYFNIIVNNLEYNFHSALGGCIGDTHENLMDKSLSRRKFDIKTLEWTIGSWTSLVLNDWRGNNIWFIKIRACWRSFILGWKSRIRVQNQYHIDFERCDKEISCWSIQPAQVKCAWSVHQTLKCYKCQVACWQKKR